MSYKSGMTVLGADFDDDDIGHGGGGGHHGGHGGHGHGGFHGGGGGWWGGPWYDDDYVNLIEVAPTTNEPVCVEWDKDKNCLRYRSDILGSSTYLGMFDIKSRQDEMNTLKQIPVSVGRILVKNAQDVIDKAIAGAKQPWYKSDLPGQTARENCRGHLEWHAAALRAMPDPNVMYGSADDLKKWAMQAFIEANAVEEGSAYIDAIWRQMWADIEKAIAALPAAIRKKVGESVEWLTGIPLWGWAVGGVAVVGLVGFVAYKLAQGPLGQSVVKRYLP